MTKDKNKFLDTKNRLVIARGQEWVKWVNGVKRYRLLFIKCISTSHVMYAWLLWLMMSA